MPGHVSGKAGADGLPTGGDGLAFGGHCAAQLGGNTPQPGHGVARLAPTFEAPEELDYKRHQFIGNRVQILYCPEHVSQGSVGHEWCAVRRDPDYAGARGTGSNPAAPQTLL
jgi:hypothetical protein